MMTDAEYKAHSKYVKDEMQPLRDEVKQIRKEEKSEIIYQLRALNAGMASVHLKVISQGKDVSHIKEGLDEEKLERKELEERVASNTRLVNMAIGALVLFSFAIANLARLLPH